MLNKRAEEKIFSIWGAFMLVIITLFYLFGVYIYYHSDVDTKFVHGQLLSERLVSCLTKDGKFNEGFVNKDLDIYNQCYLNKEIFNSGKMYFIISIREEGKEISNIIGGDKRIGDKCEFYFAGIKGDFPACLKQEIEIDGKKIRILVASNIEGERDE